MGRGTPPPSSSAGGRSHMHSRTTGASATASWRLRKKFFFGSLQKDVANLQLENAALKSIARSRLHPDNTTTLLEGCEAAKNRRRRRWTFAPPLPPSRQSVDFVVNDDTRPTPTTLASLSGCSPPRCCPTMDTPTSHRHPHLLPRMTNPPPRFLRPPLVIFVVVFSSRHVLLHPVC